MYTKERHSNIKQMCDGIFNKITVEIAVNDLKDALKYATEAGLSQEEIKNIVNEYFGQRRLNS